MTDLLYRYSFVEDIDFDHVNASLTLALYCASSLYGDTRVALESRHAVNAEARTAVIDASGELGRDLNRLFLGFVQREYGYECYEIERLSFAAELSSLN